MTEELGLSPQWVLPLISALLLLVAGARDGGELPEEAPQGGRLQALQCLRELLVHRKYGHGATVPEIARPWPGSGLCEPKTQTTDSTGASPDAER